LIFLIYLAVAMLYDGLVELSFGLS
jgi:hypothetical protein